MQPDQPDTDTKEQKAGPQSTRQRWTYGRIDREHPIGGQMSDIVRGIFMRLRLPWLLQHYARVPVLALFSFINGCISIGLMSALALVTHSPFIFPSLGPTAFLFFYTPTAPSASPRNTLVGHTIGVLAGYFSLVVTGLTNAGPALATGVTGPRVIAAALSLGLTAGLMVLTRSPHPPAGATTLIISLGILIKPWQLLLLLAAVILLTLQAIAINRLAGIPYPLWNPIQDTKPDEGAKPTDMRP
ncbi:MAG TPA: HPP family protein [Ktedonobacteraceae bacterium]|nr:HPP family protein [Ktedonobacteraceae bacterium]